MKKLMVSLVFAFAVVFLPSLAFGQEMRSESFYIPHFAVGGGTEYQNGFRVMQGWESSITVKSRYEDGTSVMVKVVWVDEKGNRMRLNIKPPLEDKIVEDKEFSFELPSRAVRQFILSSPSPDLKVGSIWMKFSFPRDKKTPGDAMPAIPFLQYRYKVNGQVLGQATIEGVKEARLDRQFSFYIKQYTGPNQDLTYTGLALNNTEGNPATCTFTRRDREGIILDSFDEVIPAFGSLARFFGQLGPPLGIENFDGSVDLFCTKFMAAVALQATGDGSNFNFSTVPNTVSNTH